MLVTIIFTMLLISWNGQSNFANPVKIHCVKMASVSILHVSKEYFKKVSFSSFSWKPLDFLLIKV